MLEIRKAEPEDAEALLAMDSATWSPRVTPTPRRDSESPFFTERTKPADVLVAERDGRILGYVIVHQPTSLSSRAHVFEINGLAVDPQHHRRGIGRYLVEEAKREAQRRGARKLTLRVLSPNAPARRLYESCGFVIEGVLHDEFALEGHLVDDILMACHFDGRPPTPRLARAARRKPVTSSPTRWA